MEPLLLATASSSELLQTPSASKASYGGRLYSLFRSLCSPRKKAPKVEVELLQSTLEPQKVEKKEKKEWKEERKVRVRTEKEIIELNHRRLKDPVKAAENYLKKAQEHLHEKRFPGNWNSLRFPLKHKCCCLRFDRPLPPGFESEKISTPFSFIKNAVVASTRGRRPAMEDFWDYRTLSVKNIKIPCFMLLDGHAGDLCARYFQSYMPSHLTDGLVNLMETTGGLPKAEVLQILTLASVKLTDSYLTATPGEHLSGATLLVMLMIGEEIFVGNAGDCRAVFIPNDSSAIALSRDAELSIPAYVKQVERRGGTVFRDPLSGLRLEHPQTTHRLNMAHAVGHRAGPNPRAEATFYQKGKGVVILGTDGGWGEISSLRAGYFYRQWKSRGFSLDQIATHFLTGAYALGSTDNITFLLIELT